MTHEQRPGQICLSWWATKVHPEPETSDAKRTRAALRRVATPVEAVGVEAVHDLNRKFADAGFDLRYDPARLMLIATALGAIREHVPGRRVAMAFGERDGERRRLGEIRFETIVRSRDMLDLKRPLIRALKMIGERADVAALGEDLFYWSDQKRTAWCFDYYSPPAPKDSNANPIDTEVLS